MGSPMMNAALRGVVMQGLMVVIGKFVPAIGQMPNFYAIAGTVLAALTGTMVSRGASGLTGASAALSGAVAGGGSSVIGGLLAAVSGQWPGFQVAQLLFPLLSGGLAGSLGGLVGRMMKSEQVRS